MFQLVPKRAGKSRSLRLMPSRFQAALAGSIGVLSTDRGGAGSFSKACKHGGLFYLFALQSILSSSTLSKVAAQTRRSRMPPCRRAANSLRSYQPQKRCRTTPSAITRHCSVVSSVDTAFITRIYGFFAVFVMPQIGHKA
jgi:hypothetical protein